MYCENAHIEKIQDHRNLILPINTTVLYTPFPRVH